MKSPDARPYPRSPTALQQIGVSPRFGPLCTHLGCAALAAMVISGLVGLSRLMPAPLVLTSWASSTALILYDNRARVNRARAVIGCHVLAALTGVVTARGCHAAPWGIGLAVGLALFAALVADVLHPPAIANAAIVFTSPAPAETFLLTATTGAFVLCLVAVGARRLDAMRR